MPRIRTIKPDFFTSEAVTRLTLRARLTWIGLWTHSDDEGRSKDNAKLIRAAVWPLDEVTVKQVEQDLDELAEQGRIIRYEVAGKRYIEVTNWPEHQKINRPQASKFPPPSGGRLILHEGISDESVNDHGGVTTGKERKGKEKERSTRDERVSVHFDGFWSVYPRKVDKAKAAKAFEKAIQKLEPGQVIEAASRFAARVGGTEQQYIPYPTTWLNGERWQDEDALPVDVATDRPREVFQMPTPPAEIADNPAAYQQWVRDQRAEWDRKQAGGQR